MTIPTPLGGGPAPTVVYIVGPYAPNEGRTVEVNIARATALGALALHLGGVPIIPHLTIGGPAVLLPDADVVARRACYGDRGGLAGLLGTVADSLRVDVWVLRNDDGSMSTGTAAEVEAFGLPGVCYYTRTWAGWGFVFDLAGLGHVHKGAT